MFSVIDIAGDAVNRPLGKACDQCKARKVRCDMKRPCTVCASKNFQCTYDEARKKRGPVGKRIQAIHRSQEARSEDPRSHSFSSMDGQPLAASPETAAHPEGDMSLHATLSNTSSRLSAATFDSASASMLWTTTDATSQMTPTRTQTLNSTFSRGSLSAVDQATVSSPDLSKFVFPSLPIESSPTSWDPFGSLLQQEVPLPTASADVWPASISEERLMPWYDVYFKRLHPTIPILNRTTLYQDLLFRKHHVDSQYGAMLLALCAFAMSQPIQIHERADIPSRAAQARMLMEECVKLRVSPDFGEQPSIAMILTSFFLFACLFGTRSHKAARLRLREAVDLAYSMGIHLPQAYEQLDDATRELWIRTYLVLSVTERAYALQQRYSIDFRGRPGMTARFMQAFDPNMTIDSISGRLFRDSADAIGMVGLLYLMEVFDCIDESVVDCWNGHCKYSDGLCENFDRRRALAMFRAQHKVRETLTTGTVWLSPTISPMPLADLMETQRADIHVTQCWILNRLWNLCSSHGLLRIASDRRELRYDYAYEIAWMTSSQCEKLSLSSMEVHGVGFAEKVFDIGSGVIEAVKASNGSAATTVDLSEFDESFSSDVITVRDLLYSIRDFLGSFRGGDHPYNDAFSASVNTLVFGDV